MQGFCSYTGVFDGHEGSKAAEFARQNLHLYFITILANFWYVLSYSVNPALWSVWKTFDCCILLCWTFDFKHSLMPRWLTSPNCSEPWVQVLSECKMGDRAGNSSSVPQLKFCLLEWGKKCKPCWWNYCNNCCKIWYAFLLVPLSLCHLCAMSDLKSIHSL